MTLQEILARCAALGVSERRENTEEYCELVFFNKELSAWSAVLHDILGPAVKPFQRRPTRDDLRATQEYGGIHDNQALFNKDFDNGTVMAMLWPWGNGTNTTLKLIFLKK